MVVAFRRWDSTHCPQCGTIPDSWFDERGRIINPPPFEPEVISCQGCRDVAELRATLDTGDEGLRVRLVAYREDRTSDQP